VINRQLHYAGCMQHVWHKHISSDIVACATAPCKHYVLSSTVS
jgi:hypothetical protein